MKNNPINTELPARFVAGCVLRDAQRATHTSTRATGTATPPATDTVKSLALLVLERNRKRNSGATKAVAPPPVLEGEKLRPSCALEPTRKAYTFKLRDGEGGGTYLTHAMTLSAARAELALIYGDRLLIIIDANQRETDAHEQ